MSMVSCSDHWFSDLLCREGETAILTNDLPEHSSYIDFPADIEDLIAGCIEEEGDYMPVFDYPAKFHSQSIDPLARRDSVAWILKVYQFYHFQPLTVYLSVNYFDRFLSSPCLPRSPQSNGWLLQLICVACLSLAAKMEEPLVPSLFDIQVGSAKFMFEPRTIRRMELLILSALDWRLRSITPFNFINFVANKADSTQTFTRFIASRATEIILIIIRDISFLDYWPSSIAAAAILCAANEFPSVCISNPENAATWCIGLDKVRIHEVDDATRTKVVHQISGGYLDIGFTLYENIFQITPRGANACTVRATGSYDVNPGSESNASLITASWRMAMVIREYVIQQNALKATHC